MKMDGQHEIFMTDLLKCNIEQKQDDATLIEHLKEEIIIYIV